MLAVEERYLPITLYAPGLTDEEFNEFCQQYYSFDVQYSADGNVIIMPPSDPITGLRHSEVNFQLRSWARSRGMGGVTDAGSGFTLPSGARLAPDVAWTPSGKLRVTPTCPEFVVEIVSPTDCLHAVRAKMQEWLENGVELGWMIDPKRRAVTIYRQGLPAEELIGIGALAGEGPVAGFVLNLDAVWDPE